MTKRMAGMQPYFFPYLGYWQLIYSVDFFVLFDEAQYIKQGWVNRNRILKHGGGWQYIGIPVAKHALKTPISEVFISHDQSWQTRLLKQLTYYQRLAPYYSEVIELVGDCIDGSVESNIGAFNARIVRHLCNALSIKSNIIISSQYGFDYSQVAEPGDWALTHALKLGATEIINPVNGISLQNPKKLAEHGIGLCALRSTTEIYTQGPAPFEQNLSIIDVMMFYGIKGTAELLARKPVNLQRINVAD